MISPGTPFRTCVEEEASRPLRMSCQRIPNPSFCSTSNRKLQETESKALEMSSLRSIRGCLCWCRNFAVCCTNMKLSWMNLPLIKALWLCDTSPCNWLASLFARIFVMSLAKLCTKLIGLKSLTCVASSLFSRSDIGWIEELEISKSKFLNLRP